MNKKMEEKVGEHKKFSKMSLFGISVLLTFLNILPSPLALAERELPAPPATPTAERPAYAASPTSGAAAPGKPDSLNPGSPITVVVGSRSGSSHSSPNAVPRHSREISRTVYSAADQATAAERDALIATQTAQRALAVPATQAAARRAFVAAQTTRLNRIPAGGQRNSARIVQKAELEQFDATQTAQRALAVPAAQIAVRNALIVRQEPVLHAAQKAELERFDATQAAEKRAFVAAAQTIPASVRRAKLAQFDATQKAERKSLLATQATDRVAARTFPPPRL